MTLEEVVFRAAALGVNRLYPRWPIEIWSYPAFLEDPKGRSEWVRCYGNVCLRRHEARLYYDVVLPCHEREQPVLPAAEELAYTPEGLYMAAHLAIGFELFPEPLDSWLVRWYTPLADSPVDIRTLRLLASARLRRTLNVVCGGRIPTTLLPRIMLADPKWCLHEMNKHKIKLTPELHHYYECACQYPGPRCPLVVEDTGCRNQIAPRAIPSTGSGGYLLRALGPLLSVRDDICERPAWVLYGRTGFVVPRSAPRLVTLFTDENLRLHPLTDAEWASGRYAGRLWCYLALVTMGTGIPYTHRRLNLYAPSDDARLHMELVRNQLACLAQKAYFPDEAGLVMMRWAPRWWGCTTVDWRLFEHIKHMYRGDRGGYYWRQWRRQNQLPFTAATDARTRAAIADCVASCRAARINDDDDEWFFSRLEQL